MINKDVTPAAMFRVPDIFEHDGLGVWSVGHLLGLHLELVLLLLIDLDLVLRDFLAGVTCPLGLAAVL